MSIRVKKDYEDKWTRARYKTKNDTEGNTIVFCCGKTFTKGDTIEEIKVVPRCRLFMGRKPRSILTTFFLINVPGTLFNALVATAAPWCTEWTSWLPLGIGVILQVACTVSLLLAGCTDPGVLPTVEYHPKAPLSMIDKRYLEIETR